MPSVKPQGKFQKECPFCNKLIHSKGFLNHFRKHNAGPLAGNGQTPEDHVLTVARKRLQEIDHQLATVDELQKEKARWEAVLSALAPQGDLHVE